MKHTKKTPLWYNPRDLRKDAWYGPLAGMDGGREGRALLESYRRMARNRLDKFYY